MKVKVAACFFFFFLPFHDCISERHVPNARRRKKKKNSLSWFCSKPGSFSHPSLVVGFACVLQNPGVNLSVLNMPPILQTWLLHLIFSVLINKTEGCSLDITHAVFDTFTVTNLPCRWPPFYHWLIPVPLITGPLPYQPHPIGPSDCWSPPHVSPTPLVPLITGPLPCQPHSIGPSDFWSPPISALPWLLVPFHVSPTPLVPLITGPLPCQPHSTGPSDHWCPPTSAPLHWSLRLLVPSPCQLHSIGPSDYWSPPHVSPT